MQTNKRNCTGTACWDCRFRWNHRREYGVCDFCIAPANAVYRWSALQGCDVLDHYNGALCSRHNPPYEPCPHYEPTRWKRFKDWWRIR